MSEHVKCINNKNWFGTVGNYYKVEAEGVRVTKDGTEEDFLWKFIEVKDDCGQLVEIPSGCFMGEYHKIIVNENDKVISRVDVLDKYFINKIIEEHNKAIEDEFERGFITGTDVLKKLKL